MTLRLLFLLCCFSLGHLTLLSQVTVTAALNNSKILIGDQASLRVEGNFPSDYTVKNVDLSVLDSISSEADPSNPDAEPGTLEILNQTEWETLTNGGTITYRKDITFTCWKAGVYFIPQIRFELERKGTDFKRATNKLTLLVSSPIGQEAAIDTVQIAPIKEIIEEKWRFSDFLPVIYIVGACILLILGIVFLIRYLMDKKQDPPPVIEVKRPAHEVAFQKLNQLREDQLWQKGEVKAYQSQLTYICREYIENRYHVPALESTTSEILIDLKKTDFPEGLVEKMREMLQLADMVKFAKAKPPEEMHSRLMIYAQDIVETTKPDILES